MAKQRRNRARTNATPLCKVDPLEPRLHLAAVAWTGAAGDNLWHTPGNWSANAVPAVDDDVLISVAANPTIKFTSAAGSQSIRSLVSDEILAFEGGSLSVTGSAVLNAPCSTTGTTLLGGSWSLNAIFTLNGGTLSTGTWTAEATQFKVGKGPSAINSVTVVGELLVSTSAAVLNITGNTRFSRLNLSAPNAMAVFAPGYVLQDEIVAAGPGTGDRTISLSGPGDFIIEHSATIQILASAGAGLKIGSSVSDNVINRGAIRGLSPIRPILIAASTFQNEGLIHTSGGLTVNSPSWGNTAQLEADGSDVTLAGQWRNDGQIHLLGSAAATLNGTWTTLGTLQISQQSTATALGNGSIQGPVIIDGGRLLFGATTDLTALGAQHWQRSSGSVAISGTLDLQQEAWVLDATTGSIELAGGTIRNGTVQHSAASQLIASSVQGVLSDVLILGDLILVAGAKLKVAGNTRFTSARLTGEFARLELASGYALSDLVIAEGSAAGVRFLSTSDGSTFQVAPGGVVRLAPDCGGNLEFWNTTGTTVENKGLIESLAGGHLLRFGFNNFLNTGVIRANNGALEFGSNRWQNQAQIQAVNAGTLTLDRAWKNSGTISVVDSTFNLGGTVKVSEMNLPGITRVGGLVNFSGGITLDSGPLTLGEQTGPWIATGGTFINGTLVLQNNDPAWLQVAGSLTLNGTVLQGDLVLDRRFAEVTVKGAARFGTVYLAAERAEIILGSGYVLQDRVIAIGTDQNARYVSVEPNKTASIGGNGRVLLSADSGAALSLDCGTSLTCNGLIENEGGSAQSLTVSLIANNGTVRATNSQLLFAGTNNGLIEALGASTFETSNNWKNHGTVHADPACNVYIGHLTEPNTGVIDLEGTSPTIIGGVTLQVFNPSGWRLRDASVRFRGYLDLEGATLVLDESMGSWSLDWGELRNGVVQLANARVLTVINEGATFTDVDIQGDIVEALGSTAIQLAGATRFQTLHVRATGGVRVRTLTAYTLHDRVSFELPSWGSQTLEPLDDFTIAPTGVLSVAEFSLAEVLIDAVHSTTRITNDGLIEVRSVGGHIHVLDPIQNNGTIRCAGGLIDVSVFTNYDDLNDRIVGGSMIVEHGGILRTKDIQRNAADITIADPGSTFEALDVFSVNEGSFHLLRGATLHVSNGVRSLVNYGLIDIDHASTLQLSDPFKQDPVGTLRLGVGPDGSFGRLLTPGTATLAGTLDIAYDQYVFSRGDEFQLLSAASIVGIFDHANVGGYHGFDRDAIRYGASGVSLRILAAADTNGDGYVNGQDYDSFADLFDSGSLLADLDGDGIVTIDDFALFVAAFMHG